MALALMPLVRVLWWAVLCLQAPDVCAGHTCTHPYITTHTKGLCAADLHHLGQLHE